MISRAFIVLLQLCSLAAVAQLVTVPIPEHNQKKKPHGRTKQLDAMALPFWDDFSFSNLARAPHDTLWEHGETVWLSRGTGINPPSLGVATFDGTDGSGKPYDVNDVLAKGIGDSLISRRILLNLVAPADRSSVFFSFYYQYRGNGEPPDLGDQLVLQFRNDQLKWETVLVIENDGTLDPAVFTQVLIPITDGKYYHPDFQFRFHSFGRLSGPYDTWNLDYVYLNKGRNASDTSYPDRTITRPLTSLFAQYTSLPIRHFVQSTANNQANPVLSTHNLEFIPGNTNQEDQQPINFKSVDTLIVYRDGLSFTTVTEQDTSDIVVLAPLQFRDTEVLNVPDLSGLTADDSAAVIKFKLWINSGDNQVKTASNTEGDYDPVKYAPIDFRWNDTTRITYYLSDHYAYDDGEAEYGAGLNQPGARLAYFYEMKSQQPDTIVAIDFYFPRFGDESTQSIEIQILKDLSGDPGSFLHRESTIIQRGSLNQFWRYTPSRFVGVQGSFYVGWRQLNSAVIAVGLDKNTNSGDRIYFNVNGNWEQNSLLTGSLMMRPVFGKFDGVITAIKDINRAIEIYPNPNQGTFYLSGAQAVDLHDFTGRRIPFQLVDENGLQRMSIDEPRAGIYVLRTRDRTGIATHRVLVQPE
ncbi:MAG: T9SS type A sorting domain-containing protein [Cyclobacteriaceae bacterium]